MTFTPFGGEPLRDVMRPLSMMIVALRSAPPRPSSARSVRRTSDWARRPDPRSRSQQAAETRISTVSRNPTGDRAGSVEELDPRAPERVDDQPETRLAVG